MRRPRFDETVLKDALDFCDWKGWRFGQLLYNIARVRLAKAGRSSSDHAVGCLLFNCENEELAQYIRDGMQE